MRKLKLLLVGTFITILGKGQEVNPYNEQGLQLLKSIRMVSEDVSLGSIQEYSQETINNYAAKLPVKTEMTVDLLSSILKTIKSPGFTILKFLENSSMPVLMKRIFKEVLYYSGDPARLDAVKRLNELTVEVMRSELDEVQKEMSLTIIAMVFNDNGFSHALRGSPKEPSCYVFGPDGSGVAHGATCIFLGAITGAWIGFEMCGVFCMVGGAIVGGIVGALS
jgi:hypothetical protein